MDRGWRPCLAGRGWELGEEMDPGVPQHPPSPAGKKVSRKGYRSGVSETDSRIELKPERIRLAMRKIFYSMRKTGSRVTF